MAALVVAACGSQETGVEAGAWQFQADTIRSETDGGSRQTSWLRVVGQEGPAGGERVRSVILSFDCFRGNTSSTIMTDQALRQGSVDIRLTLDSAAPRRISAFAGTTPTGGKVVLSIPQDSVLAMLSGRELAEIEYADGAGSSRTIAAFPIARLEELRAPFLAACANRGREDE